MTIPTIIKTIVMSLTLPFANQVDNLTGTPPTTTVGANFTAGANNADGTSVSVLSALAFDVHYLVVGIGGVSIAGQLPGCNSLQSIQNWFNGGIARVAYVIWGNYRC